MVTSPAGAVLTEYRSGPGVRSSAANPVPRLPVASTAGAAVPDCRGHPTRTQCTSAPRLDGSDAAGPPARGVLRPPVATSTKSAPTRCNLPSYAAALGEVHRARLTDVGEPAQRGAEPEPGDGGPGELGNGAVGRAAARRRRRRAGPPTPDRAAAAGTNRCRPGASRPDTAPTPVSSRSSSQVDAGHQPGGQRDRAVLRAAAVGELGRPLGVVQRRGLPLEVVEVAEQLLLPGHATTLPRRRRPCGERVDAPFKPALSEQTEANARKLSGCTSSWRPVGRAAWSWPSGLTAALWGAAAVLARALHGRAAGARARRTRALVRLCLAALLLALGVGLAAGARRGAGRLAGRSGPGAGHGLRRIVLAACGVAARRVRWRRPAHAAPHRSAPGPALRAAPARACRGPGAPGRTAPSSYVRRATRSGRWPSTSSAPARRTRQVSDGWQADLPPQPRRHRPRPRPDPPRSGPPAHPPHP